MIAACSSAQKSGDKTSIGNSSVKNDTIRIANDSLDYEIIIFEQGFNSWLATQQPRGFYNQNYLDFQPRDQLAFFSFLQNHQ